MHIGLVGGVERNEKQYRALAEARGHTLAFHSGHLAGRGSDTLAALGRSADLFIIVTDVNSHGAVQLARRVARREGVPMLLLRRCSPSRVGAILDDLAAERRTA